MKYIYTLQDPITKEIRYVGQTKDLDRRYLNHISGNSGNTDKDLWVQKLLSQNLLPIVKTLDVVKDEDANIAEMAAIGIYPNLFNFQHNYEENGEIVYSKYDLLGNKITTYSSLYELAIANKLHTYNYQNLLKVLRKERNMIGGSVYRIGCSETIEPVAELITEDTFKVRLKSIPTKPVYRYSIDGNYIDCKASARDYLDFNFRNISQVCLGQKKTHLGYRFSFTKVDKLPNLVKKKYKVRANYKKVLCYTLDEVLYKEFNSIQEVQLEGVVIKKDTIYSACTRNGNRAYGYLWRYKE